MNTDRIREIQKETAFPESRSVQQALLKVWNECEQSPETGQVDAIVIGTEAHKKHLAEAFKAGEWMEYFDEDKRVLLEMYGYTNFDEWYSKKYQ